MTATVEHHPVTHRGNVAILGVSQALAGAGPSMIVLLGGIVGTQLAPAPTLATVPVSLTVVGLALTTIPAAMLMRRIGRRRGFMAGAVIGVLGALLATVAVVRASFPLLCLATLLVGASGAFVQQYRFAATESAAPELAGRAVSLVLLGGIAGGYLGPAIAIRSKDLLATSLYAGSFLSLAVLYAAMLILLSRLHDILPGTEDSSGQERPLRQVVLQPTYLVAVLAGTVAYGVMSFIMTATPVHMHAQEGYSLDQTAWVIQSHIIAMYLPSLFTGIILERLGVLRVMLLGVLCLAACVGLAVISRELLHFWGALVLLGVGWNFLFVGATVLLTRSYRPEERFKAQATNDFTIFGIQALASLSAGTVLFAASWDVLNLLTLPLLLLTGAALLLQRRWLVPVADPT